MIENVAKRIYRICTDAANEAFDRVAFWTLDSQVQNESTGKTLQETLGSIQGITTSRSTAVEGYAVDATVISDMLAINTFTITPNMWQATGNADYPVRATINTDIYVAGSEPDWCLQTATTLPTSVEKDINSLLQILVCTGTSIELYASDAITETIKIKVKGM